MGLSLTKSFVINERPGPLLYCNPQHTLTESILIHKTVPFNPVLVFLTCKTTKIDPSHKPVTSRNWFILKCQRPWPERVISLFWSKFYKHVLPLLCIKIMTIHVTKIVSRYHEVKQNDVPEDKTVIVNLLSTHKKFIHLYQKMKNLKLTPYNIYHNYCWLVLLQFCYYYQLFWNSNSVRFILL